MKFFEVSVGKPELVQGRPRFDLKIMAKSEQEAIAIAANYRRGFLVIEGSLHEVYPDSRVISYEYFSRGL